MKRQLIALSMVIVLVASVCAVAATTVSAATPTSFSIATSTKTPMVGNKFTISGQLKTSTTTLASKPVHLESHKKNSDGTWTSWANLADTYKYTDSTGKISLTRTLTAPGVWEYRWHFNGTSTYLASRSAAVTETAMVQTKTALTVSKTTPLATEKVTFTATVSKAVTGGTLPVWTTLKTTTPITVTIYHYNAYLDGRKVRVNDYTGTTTSGTVTWQKSWPTGGASSKITQTGTTIVVGSSLRTYYAEFAGTSTYAKSTSSAVTVSVQKIPTTLTAVGHMDFSLDGYLKDQNGNALGARTIKIYYKSYSADPNTPLSYLRDTTTDADGYYSTWWSDGWYQVKFAGDATYAPSESKIFQVSDG